MFPLFNAAPTVAPSLPADRLTIEEVAAIRRLLPKLLVAANGACPILKRVE